MTASLSSRLRRLWLDVHLWIGVGLLIAIIPLSTSGAILVWKDGLERLTHPERYAVSGPDVRQAPSIYVQAAETAFKGQADFTQLRLPEKAGDPVVVVARLKEEDASGGRLRNLNVWIDPPTGKVLGLADVSRALPQWLHRLHGSLFIPKVGPKFVGGLGWAMFVSCATGLWLWWPRNGAVIKALRWRRGPSMLFNLHHMIGFWICLPLAVLSLTRVYISFPQTSRALFGVHQAEAGSSAPQGDRFAPPIPHPSLEIDAVLRSAQASTAGARIISISAPIIGNEPSWRIQIAPPGEPAPTTLQIVDASGQIKPGQGPTGGGDPLSRWMRNIHDGGDTGLIWQTIIVLGGVSPVILSITGLIMWLRRRAMARRRAEA